MKENHKAKERLAMVKEKLEELDVIVSKLESKK